MTAELIEVVNVSVAIVPLMDIRYSAFCMVAAPLISPRNVNEYTPAVLIVMFVPVDHMLSVSTVSLVQVIAEADE
jgi:hypothetical protein